MLALPFKTATSLQWLFRLVKHIEWTIEYDYYGKVSFRRRIMHGIVVRYRIRHTASVIDCPRCKALSHNAVLIGN
jgi:hypothetical protein